MGTRFSRYELLYALHLSGLLPCIFVFSLEPSTKQPSDHAATCM